MTEAAADGDVEALGVLGIFLFCAYSATRRQEARLAKRGDFSTSTWQFTILHPKGEGQWAAREVALVIPPGRQAVQDFLDLRAKELHGRGIEGSKDLPLAPQFMADGKVQEWNYDTINDARIDMRRRYGLAFDFRMLRRFLGQAALDHGARLDKVSVGMRHKSTATTERYYARVKVRAAFEELEQVWRVPEINPG